MTSTDSTPEPGALPAGTRPTRQRRAVASALQTFDDFRSAQDIHDLLRRSGENVGLSTVYRTLQALADGGELDVLRTEDGEAVYRRCSATHHHHLVCRSCGNVSSLDNTYLDSLATALHDELGFQADLGHFAIFGLCRKCSKSQAKGRSSRWQVKVPEA